VEGLAEHAVIQVGPKDPEKFIWGYNGIPFCIQLHPTIYILLTYCILSQLYIYIGICGGNITNYIRIQWACTDGGYHGKGILYTELICLQKDVEKVFPGCKR